MMSWSIDADAVMLTDASGSASTPAGQAAQRIRQP
jgi:hypothetical protein